MEIDERLIKKLIEDFTSSSKFSAEKSFNEIYDGFKEEYLNLKYHYEDISNEEKFERIKSLLEKINNMETGFIGTSEPQEQRFRRTLIGLIEKTRTLRSEVEQKIANDKQLPF